MTASHRCFFHQLKCRFRGLSSNIHVGWIRMLNRPCSRGSRRGLSYRLPRSPSRGSVGRPCGRGSRRGREALREVLLAPNLVCRSSNLVAWSNDISPGSIPRRVCSSSNSFRRSSNLVACSNERSPGSIPRRVCSSSNSVLDNLRFMSCSACSRRRQRRANRAVHLARPISQMPMAMITTISTNA